MTRPSFSRDQRGFALFATFLMLLLLASLTGASLVYSNIDLRSTSHYRTGTEALMAAESGVLHALHAMNRSLVTNLQEQLDDGQWSEFTNFEDEHPMQGDPASSYRVNIDAQGWIESVGTSPLGAARGVRVRIQRGLAGSAGALYLFNPALGDFTTRGGGGSGQGADTNSVRIYGNDCDPNTGIVRPSVTVQNDAAETVVRDGISAHQEDVYQGLGPNPSVFINDAHTMEDIVGMANNFLEPGHYVEYRPDTHGQSGNFENDLNLQGSQGSNPCIDSPLTDPVTGGPQITYLTAPRDVILNGNLCGAGILVVQGDLIISGNFRFDGLIIVLGDVTATGSATISGSLWAGALDVTVGGNLTLQYCTPALRNAGVLIDDGTFPTTMQITSWEEDNDLVTSVLYNSPSVEVAE